MESDSLQARTQHAIADLRAAYPRLEVCHAELEQWYEGPASRHSLRLDIRWPQHQSLISGPACDSADEALRAGFDAAARQLGGGA